MAISHLELLETSPFEYSQLSVFRTPVVNEETSRIDSWRSISYRQFQQDVEKFASYWQSKLLADSVPPQSVVGVWYA
jgi:hypothetical protein